MTEEKKPSKLADALERIVLFLVFVGALGYAAMNTCRYFLQNGLTLLSGIAVFIIAIIYVVVCLAVAVYIMYMYNQPKTEIPDDDDDGDNNEEVELILFAEESNEEETPKEQT